MWLLNADRIGVFVMVMGERATDVVWTMLNNAPYAMNCASVFGAVGQPFGVRGHSLRQALASTLAPWRRRSGLEESLHCT